jgi:nucleoside-diphosphate-sugar epimerase
MQLLRAVQVPLRLPPAPSAGSVCAYSRAATADHPSLYPTPVTARALAGRTEADTMKILITGAGGFIGSHLAAALAQDHELLLPHEAEMDLRSRDEVFDYVKQRQPEIVIHLAAKTEVALSFDDFEDFSRVNYVGTVLLAEANRLHNPHLKQFIFSSTMETYGHQMREHAFTETTPQFPMAPYAVAKLGCEKYLAYMQYAYKFPFTIFRQTNAYGRTNTDFFVMERIITQMLKGPVVNLGERSPLRNFLFIEDLVALYKAAINNPAAIGETFVTGPDNAISIDELVKLCGEVLHWHGTVNWNTIPFRPGEIYYLNSYAGKANAKLGWEAQWDLRDGIVETARRIERSVENRVVA